MKLAVLGTGLIAGEALKALAHVPQIEVVCIYARERSREKAERLAAQHNIPAIYTDYDRLLKESGCDFVYVGLTNSVHYEFGKKALFAGKNLIMEKPFTSNGAEAREIAAIAREKGLYVLEGVVCIYTPLMDKMKELLPAIGPVRMVQCNYSQFSSRYDKYLNNIIEPCFAPELSGGSLYDINIYNVNAIAELFGAPQEVHYYANLGHNGIDTSGTLILRYPGFIATASGAKDSESAGFIMVQGEKGYLRIPDRPSDPLSLEIWIKGETEVFEPERLPHRMVREFIQMEDIWRRKDRQRMEHALDTSVTVMEIAEAARRDAGIVFSADGE